MQKPMGKFLGERYKNHPNIIWILGGDRPIEIEIQRQTICAMAEGIREGDGGSHLITFHPTGGKVHPDIFIMNHGLISICGRMVTARASPNDII